MATRHEMHSLAQGIMGTYEARVEGIAGIREDVASRRQAAQAQQQGFREAHQAMAQQQRADLAQGHADLVAAEAGRKDDVHAWIDRVTAEHAGAQEEWQRLAATMADKRARGLAPAPTPPSSPEGEAPRSKARKRPSHGHQSGR